MLTKQILKFFFTSLEKGLSDEYDLKKIIKVAKKEFACNGTVVDHSEYGEVLQLQAEFFRDYWERLRFKTLKDDKVEGIYAVDYGFQKE